MSALHKALSQCSSAAHAFSQCSSMRVHVHYTRALPATACIAFSSCLFCSFQQVSPNCKPTLRCAEGPLGSSAVEAKPTALFWLIESRCFSICLSFGCCCFASHPRECQHQLVSCATFTRSLRLRGEPGRRAPPQLPWDWTWQSRLLQVWHQQSRLQARTYHF